MDRIRDGIARKVVRDASAVFTFAVWRKIATANPVTNAAVRKTDNRRERLAGCRRNEIAGLRWDEGDTANSGCGAMAMYANEARGSSRFFD